jgi:hypothetical protein
LANISRKGRFLLDDEDLFQALRELAHDGGLHREQHAHLQDADAVAAQRRIVQAHLEEGLAQVVVGLAGGDDAQPGVGVLEHHVVEVVGARVALGHFQAAGVERLLHLQRLGAHVHAQVHVGREQLAVELRSGVTKFSRSGDTLAVPVPSATLVTIFMPIHTPDRRDIL